MIITIFNILHIIECRSQEKLQIWKLFFIHANNYRGRHGRDHMVVGFTTTYAISLSPLTL